MSRGERYEVTHELEIYADNSTQWNSARLGSQLWPMGVSNDFVAALFVVHGPHSHE